MAGHPQVSHWTSLSPQVFISQTGISSHVQTYLLEVWGGRRLARCTEFALVDCLLLLLLHTRKVEQLGSFHSDK